ncbi:hypothetical protein NL676_025580 [Syzygium grande]|nr:hypothetical protein NL676_025580 [Syzygium grande]
MLLYQSIREDKMLNLVRWIASTARMIINLTKKIYLSQCRMTSRAAFRKKLRPKIKSPTGFWRTSSGNTGRIDQRIRVVISVNMAMKIWWITE